MAVSFVNAAAALATSVTLPDHAVGDMILVVARRSADTTPPTLSTAYTDITSTSKSGPDVSARMGYRIAVSTSETSGTWANASSITARIYRGTTTAVGGFASTNGTSTTASVPAVTLGVGDGTSWVAGETAYSADPTGVPHTINGMTGRIVGVVGTPRQEGYDTNAGVASWASTSFGIGSVSWITFAVELQAAAVSTSTGGLLLRLMTEGLTV